MGRLRDLVAKKQAVRDWHLMKLESSGMQMTIGFRSEVPGGVLTEQFPQRVTVRCTYAHDGDGLPASDHLLLLQQLDQRAVSSQCWLLMTNAGNGRRESTFQVVNAEPFINQVARVAAELGLEVETDVADDPQWTHWRDIASKLPRRD